MFKDGDQIRVRTDRSFDEVCDRVADILDDLGHVRFTRGGRFRIDEARGSGFFTEINYSGEVRERTKGDGYLIALDYEIKPSTACLVLGIISFFVCQPAALIFLFPLLAQGEVKRKFNRVLDDIEDELTR